MTAAAVPFLVGLGIWQLERATWKDGLVAALLEAPGLPPVALDAPPPKADFRRATARCAGEALPITRVGAESAAGAPGFAWRVTCPGLDGTPAFEADLGWSPRPDGPPTLDLDAPVSGLLRDFGNARTPRFRLVATDPPPGLTLGPLKAPAVADLPQNHRAYAAQWFGFAATLGVVYLVFLSRWRRARRLAPPSPSP